MMVTTRCSWCSSSVNARSVVAMSRGRWHELVLVMPLQWPDHLCASVNREKTPWPRKKSSRLLWFVGGGRRHEKQGKKQEHEQEEQDKRQPDGCAAKSRFSNVASVQREDSAASDRGATTFWHETTRGVSSIVSAQTMFQTLF